MLVRERVATLAPGLAAAALVALAAWGLAHVAPLAVGAVPIAILLGVVAGQWLPQAAMAPGLAVATRRVLRIGIVLLGARLSLTEVGAVGLAAAGLVLVTITAGLAVAWWVGTRLGLDRTLVVLLGVGSAICGNSAILATGPIIDARSREIGLAVATVTLCGTVALIAYPILGVALGLSDTAFGLLVGLAVQDTAQVVAAGAAYSEAALEVATVVKLVRNAAMALVLPLVAWVWARRFGSVSTPVDGVRKAVPGFVVGFVIMAGLRTVGVIDAELAALLGEISAVAILVAVAGLGLSIVLSDLRTASSRVMMTGAVTAGVLGIIGLTAAFVVGPLIG